MVIRGGGGYTTICPSCDMPVCGKSGSVQDNDDIGGRHVREYLVLVVIIAEGGGGRVNYGDKEMELGKLCRTRQSKS